MTTEAFTRTIRVGTLDTGYASRAVVTVEISYDGSRLSLVGAAKRPRAADVDQCGQMQDTIAAMPVEDIEIPAAARNRLVDIWNDWHLNDMQAGCKHQRDMGWRHYDEHPSEPCPVCGYKFGTAWLHEEVPAEVLTWLKEV